MSHALHSDWAAMGLAHYQPGQNAFTAKATVSTDTPPKKRGPKPGGKHKKIDRDAFKARVDDRRSSNYLRSSSFNVDIPKPGDAIKTAKIRGRSNDARTQ